MKPFKIGVDAVQEGTFNRYTTTFVSFAPDAGQAMSKVIAEFDMSGVEEITVYALELDTSSATLMGLVRHGY